MANQENPADQLDGGDVGKISDSLDARNLFNYVFGRDSKPVVQLPTERDAEEYNMGHKNRGKCIIINNRNFAQHVNLNERRGTEVDAKNLYWRFYGLNFTVERYDDLSVLKMIEVLETAAQEDHTDNDCFACCILSHGDSGVVFGTDGKMPIDRAFAPFRSDKCPTLAGKPKMFFIQACQGDKLDPGTRIMTDSPSSSFKIPNHADFLMAFSTVPGFYSWRNTNNGSWFIQGLCSVLERCGENMDLLSLMSYVNRFVAFGFESCVPGDFGMHQMKQVPYICFTLTRKVYFRPKGLRSSVELPPA